MALRRFRRKLALAVLAMPLALGGCKKHKRGAPTPPAATDAAILALPSVIDAGADASSEHADIEYEDSPGRFITTVDDAGTRVIHLIQKGRPLAAIARPRRGTTWSSAQNPVSGLRSPVSGRLLSFLPS